MSSLAEALRRAMIALAFVVALFAPLRSTLVALLAAQHHGDAGDASRATLDDADDDDGDDAWDDTTDAIAPARPHFVSAALIARTAAYPRPTRAVLTDQHTPAPALPPPRA